MKCFSDEIIQKYIDGECNADEKTKIEAHVAGCSLCQNQFDFAQQRSSRIKARMHELVREVPEMPAISDLCIKKEKSVSTKRKLIYGMAAACILLFVVLITGKQNNEPDETVLFYIIDYEVDANKPITNQNMVMYITDENGNIVENEYEF